MLTLINLYIYIYFSALLYQAFWHYLHDDKYGLHLSVLHYSRYCNHGKYPLHV